MAEVDQAIADAVSPSNVFVRMFKDAECTAPLNESELPSWKADYYRGIYNKAGQLVYVKTVPKTAPAADMLEEMVYAYDNGGNRSLEIAIALNGRPKNRFDGTAIVKKHYSGNALRETRYYDASMKPMENRYGVHRSLHRDDGIVLNYFKDDAIVDPWLDPLDLGKRVNSEHGKHPTLSTDGKELFFHTGHHGGRYEFDALIKRCVWNGTRWSEPEPVVCDGVPLTGMRPRISPDGKQLVVIGWKTRPWFEPTETQRNCFPLLENLGGCDLYSTSRDDSGRWGPVKNLGSGVNSAGQEEGGVSFNADGQQLLVSSTGTKPTADSNSYSLQWCDKREGAWQRGQSVPRLGIQTPFLSNDDQLLWFGKQTVPELGLGTFYDIHYYPKDSETWGRAVALPSNINTIPCDEESPTLSADGTILYFSRCLRPWRIHVSGKTNSETAVRHLAEIFARKEWQSPGLPLPSEDVVATSIEAAPREDTPLTQRGVLLHKDEFEDPKTLLLANEFSSMGQHGVTAGKLHALTHARWYGNLLPTIPGKAPIDGDFDVEVPGRVVGPENSHWGLMLTSFDGKQHTHGIALEISRNGTLEIAPQWYLESTSDPWSDVFSHPAILKGDRFNSVRASLRGGRKLSVWVNDQAVVLDHELKHPLLKTTVALTAKARKDRTESLWPCRAEFDRLVVSQPTSKDGTHSDLSTQQRLLTVRSSNPAAVLNASKLKLASNDKASLAAARLELIKLRAEFPGSEEAITAGQLLETEAIRGASIAYRISDVGEGELAALRSEIGDELPPELVGYFGDSRLKHWDDIWGVDFSPTGQEVASASADGTVRVWSVQTGKLTRLLGNHQGQCFAAKWAPNGKTMATGDEKGTVNLWNTDTWALTHQCSGHNVPVATLAFTSDSMRLVSAGDEDALLVWDVESGKQIARLGPPQSEVVHQERLPGRPPRIAGYRDIQFSKEDKQLYCATLSGNLEVWDIDGGRRLEVKRLSDDKLRTLSISNDGTELAIGGDDRIVRVLDAQSLEVVSEFDGTPGLVRRARFINDDKNLLVCYNGKDNVRAWDVSTGMSTSFIGHNASVFDLKISADGKTAVTAGLDNSIRLWDVPTGKQLHEFDAPSMEMRSVRLLTDGSCVAADWNGEVTRWSTNQKQLWRKKLSNNWINAIDVSKDEQKLLFASFDGEIGLLNISDGSIAEMLNPRIPGTRTAKWSPDNKLIATGAFSGTVTFWDANTGKAIADVAKLGGEIECLAWSPDQQRLAVGMESVSTTKPANVSYIIDVGTSTVIAKLPCGQSSTRGIAFSADGASVFTFGFDGMLRRFDLERAIEGKESILPQSMLVSPSGGLGLDVSPSGKQLVTSAKDGTVRFVDVETWQITKHVKVGPKQGWVNSVSYSPDGTHVSTANANGTVSILVPPLTTATTAPVLKHLTTFKCETDSVLHAVFHPDGRLIVGTRTGEIEVRELNGNLIARKQLGFGWIGDLAITQDGKNVVAGAGTNIQWLTYPELNLGRIIPGVDGPIFGMSITGDGLRIISASVDGTIGEIRSLSGAVGVPVKMGVPTEEFRKVTFLPGRDFVIGTQNGNLFRYPNEGETHLAEYRSLHHSQVRALHSSPSGQWLLSANCGSDAPEKKAHPQIIIHDSESLLPVRVINDSCINLSRAQLSGNGRFVVSTGLGRNYNGFFGQPGQPISVWDLWQNRLVQTTTAPKLGSLRSVAFSRDDKYLVVGTGLGNVEVFECELPKSTSETVDPLRESVVASRVLAAGGRLEMKCDESDDFIQVVSRADLPNGMFSIHGVTLTNTKKLSDQMIDDLGMLPGLLRLNLSGAGVTDVQLAKIAQFKSLQALDLTDCKVSDTGLSHLSQHAQLTQLILQNCNITDAGLTHLQSIPGLTVLGLRGTNISDTGLGVFTRLPELVALDLRNTTISDTISPVLKIATRLQILQLDNSKVTDDVIQSMTACPNLRRVGLSGTSISVAAVEQLATATYLRSVTVPASAGSPETLERMKKQMPWCLMNAQ
jgi:WD40 repeat protein